jgi:NADH dehydrogenase (ubiquinone) 1 alpha subcomplex subunit 9
MKYNPRDVDSIKAVMAKSNVVINLIGVFYLRPVFYSAFDG